MTAMHILGVSAFLLRDGRVLLIQRAERERFLPVHWELPGGKLEHGEHPYEGVARGVLEETGLIVVPIRPFATFHDILPDGRHYVELSILCELSQEGNGPVALSADH